MGSAIYTYLWECDLYNALERCARSGFELIELSSTPPLLFPKYCDSFERRRIKRFVDSLGVDIYSVNPTFLDINLISLNPTIREASIQEIKENIYLAYDLDAKVVVVGGGKQHSLMPSPYDESFEIAIDSINECLKLSSELGITLVLENLPYSFIMKAGEQAKISTEINSPYFKILYDVANAYMVEDVEKGLDEVLPHLGLVHFSDTTKTEWGHLPLGMGEINFSRIIEKLDKGGYDGPVILETTYVKDPDDGIEKSKKYLKELGVYANSLVK